MSNNSSATPHAASTLSDVAALRRQLDEIERNERENTTGNIRLNEITKKCHALQSSSVDRLALTAQKELQAHDDLHYITKRTKEINEVMKALIKAESVDVCFLMDCTNSMRKYIEDVKNRIFETVKTLKTRFPQLNIRLAFVGYRDLNLPENKQFSLLDFTDENAFHTFVSNVECEYGGDICEDVLGGLKKTTNLSWNQPVRILVHVGDAPSHGRRYHDLSEAKDHYLTHDADGSIGYSHIQELVELGVKYFFRRLRSRTDKMIEQFGKHAENRMTIEQINLDKFDNLLPFIVESVSRSISQATSSLMKNYGMNGELALNSGKSSRPDLQRTIVFDPDEPSWRKIRTKKLQVIRYECDAQLCCKQVDQSWLVKIGPNPFAEGGMRLAYYGLMQYKDQWEKIVFKEYKRISSGANTKDKYLELLDCQTVADYLTQEFNKLPSISNSTVIVKKLKFIMAKLVFDRSTDGKSRNLTMERFIEGPYKKFSNNAGFVSYDDPSYTLQAFSHWTYERTNGHMIVVDLQGIDTGDTQTYFLTDPCIHSLDLKRFGGTNLGKPGIKRFFQTHICNMICHALKLKRNEYQPEATPMKYDSYFVNKSNQTMFT